MFGVFCAFCLIWFGRFYVVLCGWFFFSVMWVLCFLSSLVLGGCVEVL